MKNSNVEFIKKFIQQYKIAPQPKKKWYALAKNLVAASGNNKKNIPIINNIVQFITRFSEYQKEKYSSIISNILKNLDKQFNLGIEIEGKEEKSERKILVSDEPIENNNELFRSFQKTFNDYLVKSLYKNQKPTTADACFYLDDDGSIRELSAIAREIYRTSLQNFSEMKLNLEERNIKPDIFHNALGERVTKDFSSQRKLQNDFVAIYQKWIRIASELLAIRDLNSAYVISIILKQEMPLTKKAGKIDELQALANKIYLNTLGRHEVIFSEQQESSTTLNTHAIGQIISELEEKTKNVEKIQEKIGSKQNLCKNKVELTKITQPTSMLLRLDILHIFYKSNLIESPYYLQRLEGFVRFKINHADKEKLQGYYELLISIQWIKNLDLGRRESYLTYLPTILDTVIKRRHLGESLDTFFSNDNSSEIKIILSKCEHEPKQEKIINNITKDFNEYFSKDRIGFINSLKLTSQIKISEVFMLSDVDLDKKEIKKEEEENILKEIGINIDKYLDEANLFKVVWVQELQNRLEAMAPSIPSFKSFFYSPLINIYLEKRIQQGRSLKLEDLVLDFFKYKFYKNDGTYTTLHQELLNHCERSQLNKLYFDIRNKLAIGCNKPELCANTAALDKCIDYIESKKKEIKEIGNKNPSDSFRSYKANRIKLLGGARFEEEYKTFCLFDKFISEINRVAEEFKVDQEDLIEFLGEEFKGILSINIENGPLIISDTENLHRLSTSEIHAALLRIQLKFKTQPQSNFKTNILLILNKFIGDLNREHGFQKLIHGKMVVKPKENVLEIKFTEEFFAPLQEKFLKSNERDKKSYFSTNELLSDICLDENFKLSYRDRLDDCMKTLISAHISGFILKMADDGTKKHAEITEGDFDRLANYFLSGYDKYIEKFRKGKNISERLLILYDSYSKELGVIDFDLQEYLFHLLYQESGSLAFSLPTILNKFGNGLAIELLPKNCAKKNLIQAVKGDKFGEIIASFPAPIHIMYSDPTKLGETQKVGEIQVEVIIDISDKTKPSFKINYVSISITDEKLKNDIIAKIKQQPKFAGPLCGKILTVQPLSMEQLKINLNIISLCAEKMKDLREILKEKNLQIKELEKLLHLKDKRNQQITKSSEQPSSLRAFPSQPPTQVLDENEKKEDRPIANSILKFSIYNQTPGKHNDHIKGKKTTTPLITG